MSISVNKVYRTVLSIANKEQRGLITPDNISKIGGQVQLSIHEDNIVEYKNVIMRRSEYSHADNYGDLVSLYKSKLDSFLRSNTASVSSGIVEYPSNCYKLLNVYSTNLLTKYEEIDRGRINSILSSPLTSPSDDFPIYYKNNDNASITINPSTASSVSLDFFKQPSQPRWGYSKNPINGAYIYDKNTYVETGLVIRENALNNILSNITGGVDGLYSVEATRSDAGVIDLDVTVSGGVVTKIDTTQSGTGFTSGVTLTVLASEFGVTGFSSDLSILVESSDIYSGSTMGSINFDLHPSDEVKLVTDIVAYMGISIRDETISRIAGGISQGKELSKQT